MTKKTACGWINANNVTEPGYYLLTHPQNFRPGMYTFLSAEFTGTQWQTDGRIAKFITKTSRVFGPVPKDTVEREKNPCLTP